MRPHLQAVQLCAPVLLHRQLAPRRVHVVLRSRGLALVLAEQRQTEQSPHLPVCLAVHTRILEHQLEATARALHVRCVERAQRSLLDEREVLEHLLEARVGLDARLQRRERVARLAHRWVELDRLCERCLRTRQVAERRERLPKAEVRLGVPGLGLDDRARLRARRGVALQLEQARGAVEPALGHCVMHSRLCDRVSRLGLGALQERDRGAVALVGLGVLAALEEGVARLARARCLGDDVCHSFAIEFSFTTHGRSLQSFTFTFTFTFICLLEQSLGPLRHCTCRLPPVSFYRYMYQ